MNDKIESAKRKMDNEVRKFNKEATNFESRMSVAPTAVPSNHATDSTALMTIKSDDTP